MQLHGIQLYKKMISQIIISGQNVTLNGNWIACDALLDQPLYEKCIEKNILTKKIMPNNDWDGISDFTPLKSWILEDLP